MAHTSCMLGKQGNMHVRACTHPRARAPTITHAGTHRQICNLLLFHGNNDTRTRLSVTSRCCRFEMANTSHAEVHASSHFHTVFWVTLPCSMAGEYQSSEEHNASVSALNHITATCHSPEDYNVHLHRCSLACRTAYSIMFHRALRRCRSLQYLPSNLVNRGRCKRTRILVRHVFRLHISSYPYSVGTWENELCESPVQECNWLRLTACSKGAYASVGIAVSTLDGERKKLHNVHTHKIVTFTEAG
jgi:hypothetical protein